MILAEADYVPYLIPFFGALAAAFIAGTVAFSSAALVYLSSRQKEWRDRRLKVLEEAAVEIRSAYGKCAGDLAQAKLLIANGRTPIDFNPDQLFMDWGRSFQKPVSTLQIYGFDGALTDAQTLHRKLGVLANLFADYSPASDRKLFDDAEEEVIQAQRAFLKTVRACHARIESFGLREFLSSGGR